MAREYFNAYHSYLESMKSLNDAERGRLFTACLTYSMTGEAPELRGNERFVFDGMRGQIDRDAEKYEKKCDQLRANGALGGQANATKCYQMQPNAPQMPPKEKEKEKEKAREKENGKEKQAKESADKPHRFAPPTVSEVAAYCRERNNGIDPQAFVDFYASKGWMVGKTKMHDWKSAVHTWEHRRKQDDSSDNYYPKLN